METPKEKLYKILSECTVEELETVILIINFRNNGGTIEQFNEWIEQGKDYIEIKELMRNQIQQSEACTC
ncbi:MAG: hypothetical protein FWF15_01800 [Oscillospiraceae bacterium]|nr:hypothetical protein [Oscillospiraceae bacterium]